MHLGAVAVAGLLSGVIVVVGLYAAALAAPQRVRLNPFHFLGSTVFVEEASIYWAGAVMYGVFSIAAAALQISIHRFLGPGIPPLVWAVFYGTAQYVAVGGAAALSASLHPAVRTGEIPAPGPFAANQPSTGVAALLSANLAFAIMVASLYSALS
jgi:hypothetical protein